MTIIFVITHKKMNKKEEQERSRSPVRGEVLGNDSEVRKTFGTPLGNPLDTLGSSTFGTLDREVNDYPFIKEDDEYGNHRSLPPSIGVGVIGDNGMFEQMTDKKLIRAALARMREDSDLSIGNLLKNSLTELFNATGAPFSDRDWLAVEDSVPGQSRAELASSFLDTLSLADPSSNYYGKRRRTAINELWKKGKNIHEIINVHSIKFKKNNVVGGPRYCVSYGIRGAKAKTGKVKTKFNCTILMTLPTSSEDGGPDKNSERNQEIARAILDDSDLLLQLIACYGEGGFLINISVKTMLVRSISDHMEDTSPRYAKIQLYLALFDAFMFQLLGVNALKYSFVPSDFVSKLSKVIIERVETDSLIQNPTEVLTRVDNKTAPVSVVFSPKIIKGISSKINAAKGPELNPPTDGFSLDKLASLSAIKRRLVEWEAKDSETNFRFQNDFLYPGFMTRSNKISVDEYDYTTLDDKRSRGEKRKISEPTITRVSKTAGAPRSAIRGSPPNEAKRRRLERVVDKLGAKLINQNEEDIKRGGPYATNNYDVLSLVDALGGPEAPGKVESIGGNVGSDAVIIDQPCGVIDETSICYQKKLEDEARKDVSVNAEAPSTEQAGIDARFKATDAVGKSLDKWYASAFKLVQVFATKHKTLCKEDVVALIRVQQGRRERQRQRLHDRAIETGGFGQVFAFDIDKTSFVYKILLDPKLGHTITNEADKYDKAMEAYAAKKARDEAKGLIGNMLCPTMRIFKTFRCKGKIVSLLAEPLTRSLDDFMRKEDPFSAHDTYISLFKQCLNGLSFMRNEFEFMHGDLKSNNVMLRHIGGERLDYRADDLKFNEEEVVISMIKYQAVLIDFGYSTMFDYPTKTGENTQLAGAEAGRMSSFTETGFGVIQLLHGEPVPGSYFRGYRPFMLESGKEGMTLKPVDAIDFIDDDVSENDRLNWVPLKFFDEEKNVNRSHYFEVRYIDIHGAKRTVPTVPYFIPKTKQLEGLGSRANPPLYYYNDTMDLLGMFCNSVNIKCVSALGALGFSSINDSPFFHNPPSLVLFTKIIKSIWKKEPMLRAKYDARRDAKIFHLPSLYKYIFDEFNNSSK